MHHAMDEAERLGLELGLFTSSSWNAGGTWITPKDASKKLLWSELPVEGPSEFSGTLPLPDKISEFHKDVAVIAVPAEKESTSKPIQLTANLTADGHLNWSVPKGAWKIMRFVCSNTGEFLNCPSPNSKGLVIDHLSHDATEAHINYLLDALSEGRNGLGPMKLFMLDSYEVKPAFDWTPEMVQLFTTHRGYDPTPWLPVLAGYTVNTKELSDRFLHDYHKTVSDLLVDGHFAKARELVNMRGVKLLAEGGHGGHARVDPLKALGAADIPMGEFWNHRKNWVTKEAASAAHIYGKPFVNSESFTGWQNWQDGPAAYKRLLDIALCAGLNQVTFHTFAHQPPEAGLPGFAYHAGEHFNVNSTWWNQAGPMLKDMSRACQLLQQGQFVADVCVYYGDNAPNLVPARRIAPTIKSNWTDDFCAHCGKPIPVDLRPLDHGYDYDYINEEVILTRMSVRDGKLVLPDGMSYRMMVLPDRKAISPTVLKKLGELIEAGATIVGTKPAQSNSLGGYPKCDEAVRDLAQTIWGDCDGDKIKSHKYGKGQVFWNTPLNEVLSNLGVKPDFVADTANNDDRHIDYIHRATANEDIYFVSNSDMKRQVVRCRFRVDSNRIPSFWNAEDGSITPCFEYEVKDGFTNIFIDLSPASSVFVVFTKGEARDHLVYSLTAFNLDEQIPETSNSNHPAINVLAMSDGKIEAKVWNAGEYTFHTAAGHTGTITAKKLPADQPITSPWQVSFQKDRGAPNTIEMKTLVDWTQHPDKGVNYFSGSATYHNQFTLEKAQLSANQPLILDLGAVKEVATVRVNGKEAAILWKEPYRIDIANLVHAGTNELEIDVVNTWNNRLVGDQRSAPEAQIAHTNITEKFNPKSPLLSSGLLGPVVLKFPQVMTCELK
jgi:hypothetical protein